MLPPASYTAGAWEKRTLPAMDCLDGESLPAYVARTGRLPALQAVALVAQLLADLEAAHARGFVVRGLTTGDVLVGRNGRPVHTAWAVAMRGPAREEAQREAVHRVARIAHELVAGASPQVDAVFDRALAADPSARFRSAGELSTALWSAVGMPVWERPLPVKARREPAPPVVERKAPPPVAAPHVPAPAVARNEPPPVAVRKEPAPAVVRSEPPPAVVRKEPAPAAVRSEPPPVVVRSEPPPAVVARKPRVVPSPVVPSKQAAIASPPKARHRLPGAALLACAAVAGVVLASTSILLSPKDSPVRAAPISTPIAAVAPRLVDEPKSPPAVEQPVARTAQPVQPAQPVPQSAPVVTARAPDPRPQPQPQPQKQMHAQAKAQPQAREQVLDPTRDRWVPVAAVERVVPTRLAREDRDADDPPRRRATAAHPARSEPSRMERTLQARSSPVLRARVAQRGGDADLGCKQEFVVSRAICKVMQCETAQYSSHPTCVAMRAEQRRRDLVADQAMRTR